jgi:hypothetical protein
LQQKKLFASGGVPAEPSRVPFDASGVPIDASGIPIGEASGVVLPDESVGADASAGAVVPLLHATASAPPARTISRSRCSQLMPPPPAGSTNGNPTAEIPPPLQRVR